MEEFYVFKSKQSRDVRRLLLYKKESVCRRTRRPRESEIDEYESESIHLIDMIMNSQLPQLVYALSMKQLSK